MYLKGTIVELRQCSGCLEVHVAGESPGAFPIDNCMVPPLLDPDGPGLVGRTVEYEAGMMRFLDEEDADFEEPASISSCPYPARSTDHV